MRCITCLDQIPPASDAGSQTHRSEHVNLAADDWADESPEENHEYEFDEWHEWHEDDVYAHDAWEDEQLDAEEHESVPEDLESAADQVEEAFATWQESRRLMNEMAKARGFYPVTNKLEYMQAPRRRWP